MSDDEIQGILALLLELHAALERRGLLDEQERPLVRADLLRRLMTASRCTARYVDGISRERLAEACWRSWLVEPIRRVWRKLKRGRQ